MLLGRGLEGFAGLKSTRGFRSLTQDDEADLLRSVKSEESEAARGLSKFFAPEAWRRGRRRGIALFPPPEYFRSETHDRYDGFQSRQA